MFKNYGAKLVKGIFKGSFSCFDMLMTIMPAMLLTLFSIAVNIVAIPIGIINHSPELNTLIITLVQTIGNFYLMFLLMGTITTITEWNQIHCSKPKRILYLFTFPLFMLTYVPIAVIALFRKIEWKPINHSVSKSIEEICGEEITA